MVQYITDGNRTSQFNEQMTVLETCDGKDDDCVSEYEFPDDEISDTSDPER